MTITQIEYILAVAKYNNFRKAALSCHVTQPTLSVQVQKLEEALGVSLFDRTKSPIVLTKIGRVIIEQAKIAYCEYGKIKELIEIDKGLFSGELNIGVIPTIAPYLIPRFIGSFSKNFPHLMLSVWEMTTQRCLDELDKENIDVAILATPESLRLYQQEKLFDEELLLFVNKKHPLAKKSRIKPTELHASHLWMLEEGHCLREDIITACRLRAELKKRPGNLTIQSGNLESIRFLVQEQFGYTLLPYLSTLKLSDPEKNLLRRFYGTPPFRTVYLTKRKQHLKSAAINALKTEIQKSVAVSLNLTQ
ncbi:MAG: LysR substrate-binding domain-containing protein [Gammaproteobacteria bacterium]